MLLAKRAADPNDSDSSFEQSFADIAYNYLREKAPTLLDSMIGFQVVDRNEDGDKALGVTGFKIGKKWIFAPLFFLNGALKGESLYLKDQGLFVPMDDGWINYLMRRKPNVLGESTGRDLSRIGVQAPHLYQFSRSPHKYASTERFAPWLRDILPEIATWITTNPLTDPKYASVPDMPTYIKSASLQTLNYLKQVFELYPSILKTAAHHHDLARVVAAVRSARGNYGRSVLKHAAAAPCSNVLGISCNKNDPRFLTELVKISRVEDVEKARGIGFGPGGMEGKQRETLVREKVVITDKRGPEQMTLAYRTTTSMQLTNPDRTGLYEVLVRPFKFEKCLVLMHPYSHTEQKSFSTVVCLDEKDGRKPWIHTHHSNIWVGAMIEGEEWRRWFGALPNADVLTKGESKQVLLTPDGGCTCPFNVRRELHSGGGLTTFLVDYDAYCWHDRPDHLQHHAQELDLDQCNDPLITLTSKEGGKLRLQRGELFVPDGAKLIKLRSEENTEKDHEAYPPTELFDLKLGNLLDIELHLLNKTAALEVTHTGSEAGINGKRFRTVDALVHLVAQHGLSEKQARQILDEAKQTKGASYRLKYASPYDRMNMLGEGPAAPGIPEPYTGTESVMGNSYNAQYPFEARLPVDDMSSRHTDPNTYNPYEQVMPSYDTGGPSQNDMQTLMDASQTGQKEIFDTSMLATLLKATSDENMIDRQGELMKSLDRLGRLLFSARWHYESWEDRFGKEDAIALEDSMVNTFQSLGEVVLKLKEKSLRPDEEEPGKVDLKPVADS